MTARGTGFLGILVVLAGLLPGPATAGARGYDVSTLLYQPHPFAAAQPPQMAPVPYTSVSQTARPAANQPRPVAASPVAEKKTFPPVRRQDPLWGFISEIRGGILAHDTGPFSSHEESGIDANVEVLFMSPRFLDAIWSPRPHLGGTVNSDGNTSQLYFGLTWEWLFHDPWFLYFSFGGSVHNGKKKTFDANRKELGCTVLFRESLEVGYHFNAHHSLSLFLDHISNGRLCDKNEGLENFGVRYGYRF